MKRVSEKKTKKKGADRILLLLSAIVVSICLFTFLYFFEDLKISEEWQIFVLMSILFEFTFFYGISKKIGFKKNINTFLSIILLIFFAVIPIIAGFSIFYFKLLPFPKSNLTYLVIGLLLLPILILYFNTLLSKINRILDRHKGQ